MAVRPSWEGHLRLSLVTCPVALYPATSEAETVRFNMINPATGNRIRMKTVDAGTGEDVSWPDPLDQLRQLEKDKLDAKYEIRQVLDRYREKYRISARQTNEIMWGYVDDLLSDFFYEKEEELKAEIEVDIERENQRP